MIHQIHLNGGDNFTPSDRLYIDLEQLSHRLFGAVSQLYQRNSNQETFVHTVTCNYIVETILDIFKTYHCLLFVIVSHGKLKDN